MSEVSGKVFDLKLLNRILKYVRPYKGIFILCMVLTIVIAGLASLRPYLIKYTINNFIVEPNGSMLLKFTMLMIGVLVLEAIFQLVFTYGANWLGQSIIKDLRIKLYKHVLGFKLKYFDNTPIGTLVTRAVSDIETIANIFAEGLLVIFGDLFKIIVIIAVMFITLDWRLVLLSLAVAPILYFATLFFQKAIKSSFQDVRTEVSKLNAFVQEHVTGMNIVQIFNREKAEMDKFKVINKRHMDANIRSIWYFSIFLPVLEIASAISIGLVVWYGGIIALNVDNISIENSQVLGDLTAIILYVNMMFRPLRQLADRFNTLQMGMVASDRVFKILDTDSRIEDNGVNDLDDVKGDIEFKDVVFGYNEEETILKGVSFKVKAGETLAIVGATGAGKTTIINLLNRFYPIQSGTITIDGVDIKTVKLDSLRTHIALVLQDVFLFSDSIYNNIVLDQDISLDIVKEAARVIQVDEFIEELPDSYHYNVRERGTMLSAGQRQLLAFLRAYVTNPDILILDEATSSVDTHSEILIQNAIDKITENRTSIVIAHRLATIQKADKILVMDAGRVVEEGTHQELLRKNGFYTNLYEKQFIGDEVD